MERPLFSPLLQNWEAALRRAHRSFACVIWSLAAFILFASSSLPAATDNAQYFYDPTGRLTSDVDPVNDSAQKASGAAATKNITSGATTLGNLTYVYDNAGRVASRGGWLFQSILPAAVTSASYNGANRLTSRTAAGVTVAPTFDANGSLTNDGVYAFTWDARNRMTSIGSLGTYTYDGEDRRTSAAGPGWKISLLYAGDELEVYKVGEERQDEAPG